MAKSRRGGLKGLLSTLRRVYGSLVYCPRGKHVRSRGHVRNRDGQYVSRCAYCGTPMRRLTKRNWIVDDRER